uniref:TNF receptor superfamily member 10c n=1 Tax=Cercocebus atys TaxID=9531 RepID=A0A2K5N088_CERAT
VARIPKTLKFVVVIVAVLPPVLAYSATTARQEEVSQQTVAPQQQWHSFQEEKCPAGSHRSEHTGDCNPCTEGVDYTNASNNLFSCLPCTVCKSGQTNTSSCTMTGDPVCQCEEGTFWDRNSPEMCLEYSIGCPSAEVQVSDCTSWSDSQCVEEFGTIATVETSAAEETTTAGTPASASYLLCTIVGIVVLIVFLIVV